MSWLARKSYAIDRIILPHDAKSREKSTGLSYNDFITNDYDYKTTVLERDAHEILGVEIAWKTLPKCFFDQKKCSDGIESLMFFSRQYDRTHDRYTGKSIHDKYSDGAKSFIYACEGIPWIRSENDSYDLNEYKELKKRHRRQRFV
jgi:phage terminase large subunit